VFGLGFSGTGLLSLAIRIIGILHSGTLSGNSLLQSSATFTQFPWHGHFAISCGMAGDMAPPPIKRWREPQLGTSCRSNAFHPALEACGPHPPHGMSEPIKSPSMSASGTGIQNEIRSETGSAYGLQFANPHARHSQTSIRTKDLAHPPSHSIPDRGITCAAIPRP
jgi:hypothetical protein